MPTNQVKWECVAEGEQMQKYLQEAKALTREFENFHIEMIPRKCNQQVITLNKYNLGVSLKIYILERALFSIMEYRDWA